MQFSPTFRQFISLRSKYSPQHSVCSSINVKDQVSHPYITTGEIIILFTLILRFNTEEKTKYSKLNGSKHYSNLICSDLKCPA
jgi:hypothetical protein